MGLPDLPKNRDPAAAASSAEPARKLPILPKRIPPTREAAEAAVTAVAHLTDATTADAQAVMSAVTPTPPVLKSDTESCELSPELRNKLRSAAKYAEVDEGLIDQLTPTLVEVLTFIHKNEVGVFFSHYENKIGFDGAGALMQGSKHGWIKVRVQDHISSAIKKYEIKDYMNQSRTNHVLTQNLDPLSLLSFGRALSMIFFIIRLAKE
jgi:hypothetical protein